MSSSTLAISTSSIDVTFGAFKAVDDVTINIEAGRRYSIIGPNGAGKTTLLNVLSGRLSPTRGQVFLGRTDITTMPAHRRLQAGIGRSFQIVNIFRDLTVRENLKLAAQASRFGSTQPWYKPATNYQFLDETADAVIEEVGLQQYANVLSSTLSHGEQRALELALALASAPKILLLDEPLAGVGHGRVQQTMELIERVSHGRTILLVEHNMDAVMRFSEQIIVMYAGRVIAQGTPDQVRADPRVQQAYLGS